jgi:hypothetical protein
MTTPDKAQQPQREYTILGSEMKGFDHVVWLKPLFKKCRSRPHTPAPDTMTISVKEFEQYIKDKQEQAARAATLATRQNCNERLLNVKTRVYDYSKQMSPEAYQAIMNSFDNVFYRVKSLRAAAQEAKR